MSKANPAPEKVSSTDHIEGPPGLELPDEVVQAVAKPPQPVELPQEPSPGEQGLLKLVRIQAQKSAQLDHPVATLNVAQLARLAVMYGTTPSSLARTLVELRAMNKADLTRVQDGG